jgi:hypothetical protein
LWLLDRQIHYAVVDLDKLEVDLLFL